MKKNFFSRIFKTKRPFKLTGPGWVFILYTIGVGAGAINTGNNLLYLVFGVFLGLLLASGFLSDLSLWGLDVIPTFPRSAPQNQSVSVFLKIANGKTRVPSLGVGVSLEGTLDSTFSSARVYVPYVASKAGVTARIEWTPPARGWFALDRIKLATRYPFGLLEKWWTLKAESRESGVHSFNTSAGFFVTPEIIPIDFSTIPMRLSGENSSIAVNEIGDGATMLGLHVFTPNDNPRRIHWKASAKRAPVFIGDVSSWLVREMDRDRKEEVLFSCPSPEDARSLSDADVERMVSYLASALESCRRVGVVPSISIGNSIVADETAFLALWQPKQDVQGNAALFLQALPVAVERRRTVSVLEAFRVVDAA